jgi:aryl-phospho-beta-D-glucosidase BglC (GH1 family)
MMLSLVSPKSLGVSESRLEQLSQGVNLAHWFAQTELTPETFETRITEADIEQIQSLGFRHVRLPVDPAILMLEDEPTRLNPENLPYVDAALDLIQSHDLAVIVDFHPEPDFKERLYRDAEFVDNVVVFWETWARHLSDRHPEWVFLEVINEPATEDPQDWYAMQERFLAAMRRGAPNHTLIASTNQRVRDDWSPIRALEQLEPVADPNVVYNFHFYEPKHFTHQGASWGWEMLQHYENVPFPATPETVEPLLSSIEDEQAQQFLKNYGEYRWNADRLDELISRAARWGREHRVPVTCNEFGVYRRFAPRGDRLQWIADTRKILEKYDMGWAMWSYDGGFGLLASDVDGDPIPDLEIVEALLGDER